ncbi:flagellin [Longimicrobium sp.]|uniref:flagellin N-terminal helical domain-containing protein n=1 Tax=Longimicrobium sp. TaxID=2029185 RepID=UPI002E33FCD2|nr:flagellin [Longimicrobium sp.]HEX6042771.1 flagellin [Longimicrobium sp.]
MRITDGNRTRDLLANLQRGERGLDRVQSQISSGLRVQRASDDPGAALTVLKLAGTAGATAQHRRNIDAALSKVGSEESVLDQLSDTLSRAAELGVGQGSDTSSAATRAQTRVEVDKLIEFAVQLGNTRGPDGYLFGGYNTDQRPFATVDPTVSTVGAGEQQQVEVSPGQRVNTVHNAREVFLDTGAMAALKQLSTALGANDAAGIRAATGALGTSFDAVQGVLAETGSRYGQLELTSTRLETLEQTTATHRASLEEADMEESMVNLVTRQSALQATMLSTSRILGMTLSEYLR